jgi:hypothetical protein
VFYEGYPGQRSFSECDPYIHPTFPYTDAPYDVDEWGIQWQVFGQQRLQVPDMAFSLPRKRAAMAGVPNDKAPTHDELMSLQTVQNGLALAIHNTGVPFNLHFVPATQNPDYRLHTTGWFYYGIGQALGNRHEFWEKQRSADAVTFCELRRSDVELWVSRRALTLLAQTLSSSYPFEGLDLYAPNRVVTRVTASGFSIGLTELLYRGGWREVPGPNGWPGSSSIDESAAGDIFSGPQHPSGRPIAVNDRPFGKDITGPMEQLFHILPTRPPFGGAYNQCGSVYLIWDYDPLVGDSGVRVGGSLFYLPRDPYLVLTPTGGTDVLGGDTRIGPEKTYVVNWGVGPGNRTPNGASLPVASFECHYRDLDPDGVRVTWTVSPPAFGHVITQSDFNGSYADPAATAVLEFNLNGETSFYVGVSVRVEDKWGWAAEGQMSVLLQLDIPSYDTTGAGSTPPRPPRPKLGRSWTDG